MTFIVLWIVTDALCNTNGMRMNLHIPYREAEVALP